MAQDVAQSTALRCGNGIATGAVRCGNGVPHFVCVGFGDLSPQDDTLAILQSGLPEIRVLQLFEQCVLVREQPLVLLLEAARSEQRISRCDTDHVSGVSRDQHDVGKWVLRMYCATFCNAPSATTMRTVRVNLAYSPSSSPQNARTCFTIWSTVRTA